jgi:predicted transcriptional regulator
MSKELSNSNISMEDVALLSVSRQKILLNLLSEKKNLTALIKITNNSCSSIFESLELLQTKGIVKKDINKFYSLAEKGRRITSGLWILLYQESGGKQGDTAHRAGTAQRIKKPLPVGGKAQAKKRMSPARSHKKEVKK